MVLKTCGSLLLRKIYGFISLFFPMFLSICVTYIIVFVFFCLHLLSGPSEWSALIGTGMEGECMLVWSCKKKFPMWEFSHLETSFFHAQKETFFGEKNNCGFWRKQLGGWGWKGVHCFAVCFCFRSASYGNFCSVFAMVPAALSKSVYLSSSLLCMFV